jgi:Na+:H+ antiporter, NhaA family
MNELDKNTLAARFMKRITRPVEKFMELEAASGLTLIITTLAALALANSPYAELYHQLKHLQLGVKVAGLDFVHSFEYWVNDGLMVISLA